MPKKMKIFKGLLILIAICLFLGSELGSITAQAEAPYKTYTIDGYGFVTETQTAYMPYTTISKIGDLALKSPKDMCITSDGTLYVADTGNKRIIVSDLKGNLIRVVENDVLKSPNGIYVTDEHMLYVADNKAEKVFVFDETGALVNEYGKPDHPLYGADMDFKPMKIVVNKSGNMYIICEGNMNGIVQISPTEGGTFLGYFGTNYVDVNLTQIIQRLIFTDAQRAKLISIIPSTPQNLSIDEKGLIYTVTQGDGLDTLKCLNIAGVNQLEPDAYDDIPAAVTTGNYENIYMASSQGYIYEYNNEGELLFVFGGADDGRQRIGLSKKVEAISVDSENRIYLLDSDLAQIQIYEPTEFTNLLHNALYLYSKGKYTESKEPLTKVLEMNSLFDYANKAMGRAYLQEENYEKAMEYSKLAKDWDGYSDAFWEVRNIWLQKNLVAAAGVIIAFAVLLKVLGYLQRKKGIFNGAKRKFKTVSDKTLYQQLKYAGYFMKHPIDGCYGVKREGKDSYLAANLILSAYIVVSIINKYFCGFLFKNVREGRYDLLSDIGSVFIVFVLLISCNYLICTINDGEGKIRHIYCSMAYSLTPYLIFQPVLFVVTHLVTYNEAFLVQFGSMFMNVWIVILVLIAVREINNYSIRETAKVIALTFFAVLIAVLLVFILYVLWSQVFDFIVAIGGEVVYRLGF